MKQLFLCLDENKLTSNKADVTRVPILESSFVVTEGIVILQLFVPQYLRIELIH